MIDTTLEFRRTVSRGRDTYGYNICTLYADGVRVSRCNGGGYDMQGTCLGNYIAVAFADRLTALRTRQFPKNSHWQPDRNAMVCRECATARIRAGQEPITATATDSDTVTHCSNCNAHMVRDHGAGKRVDDGRYFYGLTFHDPNYNYKDVKITRAHVKAGIFLDKSDIGKTIGQIEKEGKTTGLEAYQAFYKASSKLPTKRHTVPLIDGACGMSSVQNIMAAIGLTMKYIPSRSKNITIYQLCDTKVQS